MLTSRVYEDDKDLMCHYIISTINDETLNKAKNIFFTYQKKGVILNNDFSDNEWILTNQLQRFKLKFCIDKYSFKKHTQKWSGCSDQCFIDGIKAYAVFNLGSISITRIQGIVNQLCYIPETAHNRLKAEIHTIEFLKLLPSSEFKDQVIEELEERYLFSLHKKEKKCQRVLAEFNAYFRFNDALEMFWETASDDKKLFYFPVYLWWNLTAILPLRPTEFLLIPRKCLEQKKEENILTIRRTTLKGKGNQIFYNIDRDYKLMKYSIPEKMATELKWYLKMTKKMTHSNLGTLFVQEPHYRYLCKSSLRS